MANSIENLLADLFDDVCDTDDPIERAKRKEEFVFHMTDCRDDLIQLAKLYEKPEAFDRVQAKEIVSSSLYHALGHLIAAARLYDYVPDPFGKSD